MPISRISPNDFVGLVLIKLSSGGNDEYFRNVKLLNPLIDLVNEKKLTGFYINNIAVPYGVQKIEDVEDFTVRINYFSSDAKFGEAVIKKFLKEDNDFTLLDDYEALPVQRNKPEDYISKGYGGEELRFRKFLYISTLIGLDIINSNNFFSGQLVSSYYQNKRGVLEPIFQKNSPTYIQLSDNLKRQLWNDFNLNGYAHMFENMMQIF